MRSDPIEAVGIDETGSLWVKPTTETFPYIYREAMEVHWDEKRRCLFSPKPRRWSYADWFKQMSDAARAQGVTLTVAQTTKWSNVDADLQQRITALAAEAGVAGLGGGGNYTDLPS